MGYFSYEYERTVYALYLLLRSFPDFFDNFLHTKYIKQNRQNI